MAKIAVERDPGGAPESPADAFDHVPTGLPARHPLAGGDGWSVSDVICTAGPRDRPFEEQHSDVCMALVVGGSFQYRSSGGRELMTPGSVLLGNAGQYFECGHEHGVGDRCISFSFEPSYFEMIAGEARLETRRARFLMTRVPPVKEMSSIIARACAGLNRANSPGSEAWEELAVELAGRALDVARGSDARPERSLAAEARVTRIVRLIESSPDSDHGLASLAKEAKLSRYHFLRLFQLLTGVTPHQYLRRARLRGAAARLLLEATRVHDIALDSGFEDLSNFNHAFRDEFGVSPRSYRRNFRSAVSIASFAKRSA